MTANIYRIFRFLVADEATPYALTDFISLKYLDIALDIASSILTYTVKESHTITQNEINQGYFELNKEIVSITYFNPLGDNARGISWEYGGGKKIRIIDADYFTAGQVLEFYYRARYTKFDGVVKDQTAMNLPSEAELGTVFIAIGMYMQAKGIININNEFGLVSSKSEEGMAISYAMEGVEKPEDFIAKGHSMLRNLPLAEDIYFTVKQ